MLLGILTLITALSISAVAIYYSVAGLMTIFAAAAIPIMIMGGALEIGKLVTAVWLHRYWKQATWWLKTYLTTAVIILMFITSMGIFGFLSKAHIEQTASANEGVAQIERIEAEIARNEEVIARAEAKIQELETDGSGATAQLQRQIDLEQERIDNAYDRIQPAIEEQNQIIAQQTELFNRELEKIDADLAKLQGYIDAGDIEKAQGMVGTKVDGDYGPKTAAAFTAYQDAKRAERNTWLERIQNAQQNDVVIAAREEIKRLRSTAEDQIAQSNALINNLRNQLKSNDTNNLQTMLDEQNERVRSASSEIDTLIDAKFKLEGEYRKLEAEVGPVKYIAEFIYGETANNNLLEEAVRWVIIVIIFVFDPLAVLLLIASQYTFEFNRKRKDDDGDWHRQYEQSRAQRIVDNPGYDTEGNDVTAKEESTNNTTKDDVRDGLTFGTYTGDTQTVPVEQNKDTQQDEIFSKEWPVSKEEKDDDLSMETTNTDADATVRDMVPEDDVSVDDATEQTMEQDQIQPNGLTREEVAELYNQPQKKSLESSEEYDTELAKQRTIELDELEQLPEWSNAKRIWKSEHPDLNLKQFKNDYIRGKINELPWQTIAIELATEKQSYIIKDEEGNQIHKETYVQNGEQNDQSIWSRIKKQNDN
jgi:hypothetical protein